MVVGVVVTAVLVGFGSAVGAIGLGLGVEAIVLCYSAGGLCGAGMFVGVALRRDPLTTG